MPIINKYYNDKYGCFVLEKQTELYDLEVFSILKSKAFYGVPRIFDIEIKDNLLISNEEYIDGFDLDCLMRTKYFDEFELFHIITQLCNILKPLHCLKTPIIHRDIKPSNIMMKNNKVYLIDFNISKIVKENVDRDTMLLGSNGFAAPEQYGFGQSNIQTDIYGIGATLKYVLEKQQLDYEDTLFAEVINKCMEVDLNNRYKNVDELKQALLRSFHEWEANKNKIINNKSTLSDITNELSKFVPVGYRNDNSVHGVLATIGYLFLLWISKYMTVKGVSGKRLLIDKIAFFAISFASIQFIFNYLNCHSLFQITKIKNKFLYWIVVLALNYLLIIAVVVIYALIIAFVQ